MSDDGGGYLIPPEFLYGREVDVTPWWLRPLVALGLVEPRTKYEPGVWDLLEARGLSVGAAPPAPDPSTDTGRDVAIR